jgi:cob(I)alamin adenosyltransferase
MGHRLSKIVTRTGDSGSSGLANGERLSKTHPRFAAMGDADELNCQLGLLLEQPQVQPFERDLRWLQHRLFDLGGELALPETAVLDDEALTTLEHRIGLLNAELPPLKDFVLPGGGEAAARAHLARAIARRLERSLWVLHEQAPQRSPVTSFANRLSDYLFVLARTLARTQGAAEDTWVRL